MDSIWPPRFDVQYVFKAMEDDKFYSLTPKVSLFYNLFIFLIVLQWKRNRSLKILDLSSHNLLLQGYVNVSIPFYKYLVNLRLK